MFIVEGSLEPGAHRKHGCKVHFCPCQYKAPSTFDLCERTAQIPFVFLGRKKIIQSWNDILTDFYYSFTDALWPVQQFKCF